MVCAATEKIGGVQSKERLFCCTPESVAVQVCLPLALAVLCLLEVMGGAWEGLFEKKENVTLHRHSSE